MVSKNNKRVMITIPKDFDRLILKAKAYSLGESLSNGNLFIYLILIFLYKEGYLSDEEFNKQFGRYFYDK